MIRTSLNDVAGAAANRRKLAELRREELGTTLWRGISVRSKKERGAIHRPRESEGASA